MDSVSTSAPSASTEGFVAEVGLSESVQVELDPAVPPEKTFTTAEVRTIVTRTLAEFGIEL